jgi:hypothetical protein
MHPVHVVRLLGAVTRGNGSITAPSAHLDIARASFAALAVSSTLGVVGMNKISAHETTREVSLQCFGMFAARTTWEVKPSHVDGSGRVPEGLARIFHARDR